jgi:hypothetical protein
MHNFFVKVQGILSDNSKRKILSAVNKQETDGETCCLIFVDYSDFDIPVGERFLYLIELSDSKNAIKIDGKLIMVTQNQGLLLESIPKGHKTICQVCFDKNSYEMIMSKIPILDTWQSPLQTYLLSNSLVSGEFKNHLERNKNV